MELHEIAEKHPGLKKRIETMQTSEKTAKLLLKVAGMPGVKLLTDQMALMIEAINARLLDETDPMEEKERACLFRERACFEWLIGQFDKQHAVLKRIDEFKEKYAKVE